MPPGYVLISWAAMLRWLHFVTMWIIEGAPILSGFVEGAKYLKSALPHKRKWVLQQVAAVVSGILTVSLKKYFFILSLSASMRALKQSLSGCEVQQCLWDHDTQWTCAEVSGVSSVSGGNSGPENLWPFSKCFHWTSSGSDTMILRPWRITTVPGRKK